METTSKPVANRYEFVYLFDVTGGNPNGDLDAGNQPRIDPETGHGLVTDVFLKRKIRNFVTLSKRNGNGPVPGYDIYVKESGILANEQRKAYVAGNRKFKATGRPNDDARDWICHMFYDVCTFGSVMTTGKIEGKTRRNSKNILTQRPRTPYGTVGKSEAQSRLRSPVPLPRFLRWSMRLQDVPSPMRLTLDG